MEMELVDKELEINDNNLLKELFGKLDENINFIEKEMDTKIFLRENKLILKGREADAESSYRLILKLIEIIKVEGTLSKQNLEYTIELVKSKKKSW